MDFDEMKAKLFASSPLRIAKKDPVTNLNLLPEETPTGNGIRIAVLRHRYLKEVNGDLWVEGGGGLVCSFSLSLQSQSQFAVRVLKDAKFFPVYHIPFLLNKKSPTEAGLKIFIYGI
ncbi:hypothetical protein [Flavobacterium sp.]|uniref:hypothetical protein n=1 Tax=Flavobacterium sp. TaxID=239 RepID=UPI0025F65386|nr:hypothetical protein [Flavobacterium sp.]